MSTNTSVVSYSKKRRHGQPKSETRQFDGFVKVSDAARSGDTISMKLCALTVCAILFNIAALIAASESARFAISDNVIGTEMGSKIPPR